MRPWKRKWKTWKLTAINTGVVCNHYSLSREKIKMRFRKLEDLKKKIEHFKMESVTLDEMLAFTGELMEYTNELVCDIQKINSDLKRIEADQQQLQQEKEEVSQLLAYIASLSRENPQKALQLLETFQSQDSNSKLIN